MLVPHDLTVALAMMVLTMLCRNSWANTAKLVPGYRFELFYPLPARAQLPPHGLDAYLAMVTFSSGVLLSSVLPVPLAAAHPITAQAPLAMSGFVQESGQRHLPGMLGGAIWCIGTTSNVLAAGVTGPAIAHAFCQGATMIAALSGVFIWKEFRDAPELNNLLALMFVCYAAGLVLIGLSPEV